LINFLGVFAQVVYTVCGFPQIYKLYKTKNSQGLSLFTWILMIVAHTSNLIYMFCINVGWILVIGLIISLINTILIFIGIVLYSKRGGINV
jgi:uncharacterized protein with PQ loop repeat